MFSSAAVYASDRRERRWASIGKGRKESVDAHYMKDTTVNTLSVGT